MGVNTLLTFVQTYAIWILCGYCLLVVAYVTRHMIPAMEAESNSGAKLFKLFCAMMLGFVIHTIADRAFDAWGLPYPTVEPASSLTLAVHCFVAYWLLRVSTPWLTYGREKRTKA